MPQKSTFPLPEKSEFDETLNLPFINQYNVPEVKSLKLLQKIKFGEEDEGDVEEQIEDCSGKIEDEVQNLLVDQYFNGMELGFSGNATIHYAPMFSDQYIFAVFPNSYSQHQKLAFLLEENTNFNIIKRMLFQYMKDEQIHALINQVKTEKDKWILETHLKENGETQISYKTPKL